MQLIGRPGLENVAAIIQPALDKPCLRQIDGSVRENTLARADKLRNTNRVKARFRLSLCNFLSVQIYYCLVVTPLKLAPATFQFRKPSG